MKRGAGHEPGLYISEDGRLECAEHLPYAGSDTHRAGRYVRLTEDDERAWRREQLSIGPAISRLALKCEICGKGRTEAEAVER